MSLTTDLAADTVRSHQKNSPMAPFTRYQKTPPPTVGVSLLAIAMCQSNRCWLILRYREQAHSYKGLVVFYQAG